MTPAAVDASVVVDLLVAHPRVRAGRAALVGIDAVAPRSRPRDHGDRDRFVGVARSAGVVAIGRGEVGRMICDAANQTSIEPRGRRGTQRLPGRASGGQPPSGTATIQSYGAMSSDALDPAERSSGSGEPVEPSATRAMSSSTACTSMAISIRPRGQQGRGSSTFASGSQARADQKNQRRGVEFPRFRGHLTAARFGVAERMSSDAQDPAVFQGVQA